MKNYMLLIACISMPLFAAKHGYDGTYEPCCTTHNLDHVSNTFMYTRPILQNLSTRQAIWHNFIYEKHGDVRDSFQSTFVFQQSLSLPITQWYFLPCELDQVLVAGDDVTRDLASRTIRAEWLNLPPSFEGTFTINPKQTQAGAFLEFNQDLGKIVNHSFFEGAWVSICLPVVLVENDMNLKQDVFSTTTGITINGQAGPTDIKSAFNQCDWWYAKIGDKQTNINLADINIQIGRTFTAHDNFYVAYYSTVIIPTGNIQDAKYLFEPVSGNNGHFGIGAGVDFQFPVNRPNGRYDLCFFLDFESIFFARNTQWRTFDLRYKPYSRYLQFVAKDDPTGQLIPGVNVLTYHVQVHPYNIADVSGGFRLITSNMEIELGYSLWGHGDETLSIYCDNESPRQFGIAGNQNAANELPAYDNRQLPMPATASKSTISAQAANDVECAPTTDIIIGDCGQPYVNNLGQTQRVFVPITLYDIDLSSGISKSAFNQKFQCAVGFMNKGKKRDLFFGAGGYYDKPVKRGALNTLGAWVKMGASF